MVKDEFYHVYNRTVEGRDLFCDDEDRRRFLRSSIVFNDHFLEHNRIDLMEDGKHPEHSHRPLISIVAYALMDNHFHFLIQQHADNAVARFMHRLGIGYTKYFNRKYNRTGSLFESSYKAVLINGDEQLLNTSRYIHLNPLDTFKSNARTSNFLETYPWSSYRHYLGLTSDLVVNGEMLNQLLSKEEHRHFVSVGIDNYQN